MPVGFHQIDLGLAAAIVMVVGDEAVGVDRHVAARSMGVAARDVNVLVAAPFDAVVRFDVDGSAGVAGVRAAEVRHQAGSARARVLGRLLRVGHAGDSAGGQEAQQPYDRNLAPHGFGASVS